MQNFKNMTCKIEELAKQNKAEHVNAMHVESGQHKAVNRNLVSIQKYFRWAMTDK